MYGMMENNMPARKSARRTRSISWKRCSKSRAKRTCSKKKTCSWRSNRSPRCRPKGSRRKPMRSMRRTKSRSSRPSQRKRALGALMSKQDLESAKATRKCASTRVDEKCDAGCIWDPRKGCVPEKEEKDSTGKFMDGSRYLTFRSNKKPAFSFRIPVNEATLFGEYRGAIRWSPATGKLHLCYGPIIDSAGNSSDRPLLNMLVQDKVGQDVWEWYESSGRALQKKRVRETAADDPLVYAEIYGLPGASMQLSWAECMYLDKKVADAYADTGKGPQTLGALASAPNECPPFLGTSKLDDCFDSGEYGSFWDEEKVQNARKRRGKDYDYNPYKTAGKEKKKYLVDDEEEKENDDEASKRKRKMKQVMRKSINLTSPLAKSFAKDIRTGSSILIPSLRQVERERPIRTERESASMTRGSDARVIAPATLTPLPVVSMPGGVRDGVKDALSRAESALGQVADVIFKANGKDSRDTINALGPEDKAFLVPVQEARMDNVKRVGQEEVTPDKVVSSEATLKRIAESCINWGYADFERALDALAEQVPRGDGYYMAKPDSFKTFGTAIVFGVKGDMLRAIAASTLSLASNDLLVRNKTIDINFERSRMFSRSRSSQLSGEGFFGNQEEDYAGRINEIVTGNPALQNIFSLKSTHRSERNLHNKNSRYSSSQSEFSDYSSDDY